MRLFDRLRNKLSKLIPYKGVEDCFKQPDDIRIFTNTRIHPYTGLYLNENDKVIAASAFHDHKLEKLVNRSRVLRTIESDHAASIGHGSWNNYYHWYIDSLPRVYGLRNTECEIELFVSQILSKEEKQLLNALAGDKVKIRFVSMFTIVKAKTAYYLPFLSESCNAELPASYLRFFQGTAFKLFPQTPPAAPFKIFISRAGSGRRVFKNQLEVEEVMQKYGYMILQLETLTLSQQIYYFRFAERVVGSHGAGLTNLLYTSNCSVLEIFHSDEILGHYKGLCKALGLNYDYLSLSGKHKDETVLLPVERIKDWITQ